MIMDFRNALIQPTILPVLCSHLRPCERRSFFTGIGYIPSKHEKYKYFNILDEIFKDRSWIEWILEGGANLVLYGNNISSLCSLNRSGMGIGAHLYLPPSEHIGGHTGAINDLSNIEYKKVVSRIKENIDLSDIQHDMHLSNDVTTYDDTIDQQSFLLSFTYVGPLGCYKEGFREDAPIDFNTEIVNELNERPGVFYEIGGSSKEGFRYFETDHIAISKHGIFKKKLYIMAIDGYECLQCESRCIDILITRDEDNQFVHFPRKWIDHMHLCHHTSITTLLSSYTLHDDDP